MPHIVVTTGSEEAVTGEVTPLALGLGLHMGWTYSCMYGSGSVFAIDPSTVLHGYTWLFLFSIIFFAATLIILGLLDNAARDRFFTRNGIIFGTAFMVVGTLLATSCANLTGTPLNIVSVIAGVFTGVGSGLIFIFWGVTVSMIDYYSLIINAGLALVIAIAIYAVLLQIVPVPFCGLVACLLPIGEAAVLLTNKQGFFRDGSEIPVFKPLPIHRLSFSYRVCLPVAFFGIAAGLLKATAIIDSLQAHNVTASLLMFSGAIVAFLFITLALGSRKNRTEVTVFKLIVPLVCIAAVLIPFTTGESDDSLPAEAYILAVYFAFEISLLIYFNELTQSYRLSPIYIFGLGRGTMAISALLGSVITIFQEELVAFIPWGDTGGGVIILLCLAIGMCSLPSRSTVEHAALNTCSLTFYYKRDGSTSGNLNKVGIGEPKSGANASIAQASNSDSRQATGTIDDPIPQKELLQAQCEAIANCYLLSQRETEVCYYLAKGYNSRRIQEILYISEGTAKTHIRHIYRKLNIHSQQDLIRMVDETLAS